MTDEEILQAGLDAICDGWLTPTDPPYPVLADVERVVDAVRPLLEARLRERLAAAIEAGIWPRPVDADLDGWNDALETAARIVRERP